MRMIVVKACLLLCAVSFTTANLAAEYNHFVALDPAEKMKLYWTVNRVEKTISFAVEATTTGWVGFGFSTGTGRMKGADIVIGWVKEGKAHLTDRHGEGQFLPPLDKKGDYNLIGGTEENGTTILKFKRKINTCDSQDRKIDEGTTKVIFSYDDEDPVSETNFKKHEYKGMRNVMLLNNFGKKGAPDPNWGSFDVRMDQVLVPSVDTSYLCRVIKVPNLGAKKHVVRFQPIITPGNEGLVHHMEIAECFASRMPDHHINGTVDCMDFPNMPQAVLSCKDDSPVAAAWAVGGGPFVYPDHTGFPVSVPGDEMVMILEIHYDNPERLAGKRDSSGMRFFYTSTLRRYDSATISVGIDENPWMMIPPGQTDWVVQGHCTRNCTEEVLRTSPLPEKGIKIFAAFLHTHLAGRATWTKHVRNGVELTEIARDDNYDFNFQEFQYLNKEAHVLPGDEIRHSCSYQTTGRTNTTFGGLPTKDEMCLVFMLYYPRIPNLLDCLSLDVQTGYNFLKKYHPNLQNKANYYENPLTTVPIEWTELKVKDFLEAYNSSKKVTSVFCKGTNKGDMNDVVDPAKMVDKVEITKPLPPPKNPCTTEVPSSTQAPSIAVLCLLVPCMCCFELSIFELFKSLLFTD